MPTKEYMREYRKKNIERIRELHRLWTINNPEKVKQHTKTKHENYKSKHPELVKEQLLEWKSRNKDKVRQHDQKYYFENQIEILKRRRTESYRAKHASYERKRRATKRGCFGNISDALWNSALEFYGNVCLCCGTHNDITLDHVIPLSLGGKHEISNAQPLCLSCNSSKGNRNTIDYRNGRIFTG